MYIIFIWLVYLSKSVFKKCSSQLRCILQTFHGVLLPPCVHFVNCNPPTHLLFGCSCRCVPTVVRSLSSRGQPLKENIQWAWRWHATLGYSKSSIPELENSPHIVSVPKCVCVCVCVGQAEADSIDALERYRGKCEPTFLFYGVSTCFAFSSTKIC